MLKYLAQGNGVRFNISICYLVFSFRSCTPILHLMEHWNCTTS